MEGARSNFVRFQAPTIVAFTIIAIKSIYLLDYVGQPPLCSLTKWRDVNRLEEKR